MISISKNLKSFVKQSVKFGHQWTRCRSSFIHRENFLQRHVGINKHDEEVMLKTINLKVRFINLKITKKL